MLHLGLNGAGLRLMVGIVHLVRVHVAHSILVTGLVLLVRIALRLILAVALVLSWYSLAGLRDVVMTCDMHGMDGK
jgi:hypothetical protein